MGNPLKACIAALCLLASTTAFAQEMGEDEVTLKNGGSVRGTVVSSEPGTSVKIIELGQKEARVIPWAQVSDVERGKYARKAPAQPGPAGPGYGAPAQAPPPEATLGTPGVVRLHIDSPVPASLVEHVGTAVGRYGNVGLVITQIREACRAPCDKIIDGRDGQEFLLTGQFPTHKPFRFEGMTGDVNLKLEPGSIGGTFGGATLLVFGISSLLVGAILLPVGLASKSSNTLKYSGAGLLGGGALAIGGGIPLLLFSRTKVTAEQRPAARGARAPRYWLGEF